MPFRFRCPALLLAVFLLTGCTSSRTTWDLAQRAVAAMGGAAAFQDVRTLVLSGGAGTRHALGQGARQDSQEVEGTLGMVRATLDLAGGRAAFEYDASLPTGFMQHRLEVLTRIDETPVGYSVNDNGRMASTPDGLFGWGPASSPDVMLRRNVVTLLLEAARNGAAGGMISEGDFNGNPRLQGTMTASWGERFNLYFDRASERLVGFETLDTDPMLGDTTGRYILGDYREAGSLMLPHRVTVLQDDQPYSDVRYASIAVNGETDLDVFEIPADLAAQAEQAREADGPWVPLTWTPVDDGVFHVVAYSHHSMVVEFPTFVAVVEAPYTEAQSLALARLIGERIPDKPIRFAAVSHPHWDHIGGVRGMASLGATIVVASGHESRVRTVARPSHTNPPDRLQEARAAGSPGAIEIFDESWAITEEGQTLSLYEVSGSPHVEPVVLAYVSPGQVLFQSDLFFPGTGAPGTPASRHLEDSIRELRLTVRTLVGGHGGVGPFSELSSANRAN